MFFVLVFSNSGVFFVVFSGLGRTHVSTENQAIDIGFIASQKAKFTHIIHLKCLVDFLLDWKL